jgi:hypothetical protein
MTTRTYYMPKNRISLYIISNIIDKIGCSIGDIKVQQISNTIRVPITCNDNDIPRVEKILKRYDILGE